jgi:steroid delta-isomerase-like uncharacterized protein
VSVENVRPALREQARARVLPEPAAIVQFLRRSSAVKNVEMADPMEAASRHDEAFNAQDVDGRLATEAPDIELVMPGGMTLRGREQTLEVVKVFWEALPDGRISADNQFAAGDTVVAEGTLSGTHTGTFRTPQGDIPASGNRVTLRYATVKQIRDGKVAAEHLYFDRLEFLQQLGALPAEGR